MVTCILKMMRSVFFILHFNKDGIALGSTAFITINGVDFYVGAGNRNIQYDKSDSEINMVSTSTILAMDGNNDYFLVVGTPIKQYTSTKDKLRQQILSYNHK